MAFVAIILVQRAQGEEIFSGNGGKGRGVIFCLGPIPAHFMGIWASIKVIREDLMSKLPIELWMYDFEWDLLSDSVQDALHELEKDQGVSLHFLKKIPARDAIVEDKSKRKGTSVDGDYLHFSTKPRALLESRLDEVILLDSDAFIFVKPEELFEQDLYRQTGTLFLYDRPLDWWPPNYPPHDPQWLANYIRSGYSRKDEFRQKVALHSSGVEPPREVAIGQESYRACRGTYDDGWYCTQHRQESSMVIFDKRRQQRCAAVLWDLTVKERVTVYERIYGDKDSYWLACELADSPYAFSPWAPAHWSPLNGTDSTCPDLVIEPHFAHFLPPGKIKADAAPRLMSVNQLKVRAVLGGKGRFGSEPALALSPRMTLNDMHSSLVPVLQDPMKCPKRIAAFRRVQRCWSRQLQCVQMTERDANLLKKHARVQKEARVIFSKR